MYHIFFRLGMKEMMKCILSVFMEYHDILRDLFLLVKMTLAVGGLKHIYILTKTENASSNFEIMVNA